MRTHKTFIALLLVCTVLFSRCTSSKLDSVSKGYMKEASAKYNKHDYAGTLKIGRKAVTYDPKNFYAYQILGSSYLMMEKYDTAIKEYDTVIAINPKDNFSRFNRSYALGMLKKYDSAMADNDFNIRNNYLKACSYNNRGVTEDKLKHYDAALKDYDSCLKTGYYYHRFVLLNKANIYSKLDRYDLAMKAVDKCINDDPWQLSYPAHTIHRFETYLKVNKTKFLKDTSFLKDMRHFGDAYTYKGGLLVDGGRYKQALYYLTMEKVLPLPDYFAPINKGRIAFNTMQYDTAINYFNEAIAMDSTISNGYLWRGFLYYRLKQYQQAAADYNKAIKIDSSYSFGYLDMGKLNILLGNNDSAIAYTSKAIEKNDEETLSDAYNQRGYVYFLNNQYKEAIANYDSAVKLGTSWYQPYYNYKQEAVDALEKKGGNFCTLLQWQAPISDVNYLRDSARFYVASNESIIVNFKIVTNHPIIKDDLFVMMGGTSVANGNNGTIKTYNENEITGKFEYEFAVKLKFEHGRYLLYLDYLNKQSQRMEVVVE